MATLAETQTVVSRASRWAGENPRQRKVIQTDLQVLMLMTKLRVSQASAASSIGQFMVRAALQIGHNEELAPLKLLAKYRVEIDNSEPVFAALKDLRDVVIHRDRGERVLHRLTHLAGGSGCNLYQLAKLLHCLADEGGPDERPDDASVYLRLLTGDASNLRYHLKKAV